MPDKYDVQKKKPEAKPRFNDMEFVNIELDAEQKIRLKSEFVPQAELNDLLFQFCEAGYRVMVKWDNYSSAYACFVQRTDGKKQNENMILTGRGSQPWSAIFEVAFKHFVLLEGDWPTRGDRKPAKSWDEE